MTKPVHTVYSMSGRFFWHADLRIEPNPKPGCIGFTPSYLVERRRGIALGHGRAQAAVKRAHEALWESVHPKGTT